MDRHLPILNAGTPAQTCVWMDAGVLAFRLCDRGFACDHCPFDAAMRRDPREVPPEEPGTFHAGPVAWAFPPDRLYTDAHLWVQTVRDGRVRAGIDAYASRLLYPGLKFRPLVHPGTPDRGDPWCVLVFDGRELPLGSPVAGRVCCWNNALLARPALATEEPYGAGWIAEIVLTRAGDLDGLLSARAARERAEHDARQFRRNVAFSLLSAETGAEPGLETAFLEATRRLVGPGPFVHIARQFLH